MKKLSKAAKKSIILSVFSNTDLDRLFIMVANELGYSEYYTELKGLDDMTSKEVDICYERTCEVALGMNRFLEKTF